MNTMKCITTILLGVLLLTSNCSNDDSEPSSGATSGLKVNGKEWKATSNPNFDEDGYYYFGGGHFMFFDEDLTDAEVGDDVSPSYIVFMQENAEYEYEDGEAIVTKVANDYVEVRFDNLEVSYSGTWESILPDNRDGLSNNLKLTGKVKFYRR